MLQTSQFMQTIEQRKGPRIGSPEEIAWLNGWVYDPRLVELAMPMGKIDYGQHLLGLPYEGASLAYCDGLRFRDGGRRHKICGV